MSAEDFAPRPWIPQPLARLITLAWWAGWIYLFTINAWEIALVMMFLTAPVTALLRGGWRDHDAQRPRRLARHEERRARMLERRDQWHRPPGRHGHPGNWQGPAPRSAPAPGPDPRPVATAPSTPPPTTPASGPSTTPTQPSPTQPSTSAAERALAATVIRAESSASRVDADALDLVREVDHLLRPLLAHVRARGADPLVRRDLEAIATEHLPGALDAYLVLPTDYAHEHRTATGTTPADELRSQLTLLVEGCRQLRDAVHDADVDRQQQLSRYLDAKFRRSDLDL